MLQLKYKKAAALLCAACMLLFSLSGCGDQQTDASTPPAGSTTGSGITAATVSAEKLSVAYLQEDLEESWSQESATANIDLNGSTASIEGSGASVSGSTVTITAAGVYVLSGTLDDGQIIIDAGKNDLVRLILNGVDVSCSNCSPIYAKQADKTVLTLAQGSENIIRDGSTYVYADEAAEEPNAAIFSKDDLTINGSGSLTVIGSFHNGIGTKDDLIITNGIIAVTAINDALRGRDSVAICGGTFALTADGDAIQSNNNEDAQKGWISLDGGSFQITAGNDGVQAETILQISAGEFNILTGGGSANGSTTSQGAAQPGWGNWGNPGAGTTTQTEDTPSAKGLKSGVALFVTGGSFTVDSSDDSIHCNGSIQLDGGEFAMASGDDGVHADTSLVINDCTMEITQCFEGLESDQITINGGDITLTTRDDGINAAGGNDGSSVNGRPGQNAFSSSSSAFIRITGGAIKIDAAGDGLDSNGALYLDGGSVYVDGPTDAANGAMDYDGECLITGGVLAAAGSAGMAQTPSQTSTQNSLLISYSSVQKAGTLFHLEDASGNTVFSYMPSKDYQSILICMPELEQQETYTVYSGGSDSGTESKGQYTGGTYSGGTKLTEVTLSGSVTSISDSGQIVQAGGGMMGGHGGGGGMMERPSMSMPEGGAMGVPPDGTMSMPEGVAPGARRNQQDHAAGA